MGKLLRNFWMNVKLNRGRCEWCSAILADVHPIPNYRTCSEGCAAELSAMRMS